MSSYIESAMLLGRWSMAEDSTLCIMSSVGGMAGVIVKLGPLASTVNVMAGQFYGSIYCELVWVSH